MVGGDEKGCYYRTLEVPKTATIDEIKASFRRLSKETHPDVAKNANPELFKRISAAATVLTDPKQKRAYDIRTSGELSFGAGVGRGNPFTGAEDAYRRFGRNYQKQNPTTNAQIFFSTFFRPRNLAIGSIAVVAVSCFSSYLSNGDKDLEPSPRVHAWKNPKTGRWEQPTPWDPLYKELKPNLELVPREQVTQSKQTRR